MKDKLFLVIDKWIDLLFENKSILSGEFDIYVYFPGDDYAVLRILTHSNILDIERSVYDDFMLAFGHIIDYREFGTLISERVNERFNTQIKQVMLLDRQLMTLP